RVLYVIKLTLHGFAVSKRDLQGEAFQGFVASCDTFYELDHNGRFIAQRRGERWRRAPSARICKRAPPAAIRSTEKLASIFIATPQSRARPRRSEAAQNSDQLQIQTAICDPDPHIPAGGQ